MKYKRLSPKYIANKYNPYLKKYSDIYHRGVDITIVPNGVSEHNIEDILNTMIETGYTFIAAYYSIKDIQNKAELIRIDEIEIPGYYTEPKQSKLQSKLKALTRQGYIKPLIVDDQLKLVNGHATLTMFMNLGELYVPCFRGEIYKHVRNNRLGIETRDKLYSVQNGKCYICGRTMELESDNPNTNTFATVDHVVPLIKGGTNDESNLALCCAICNNLKSNFTYSENLKQVIIQELSEKNLI